MIPARGQIMLDGRDIGALDAAQRAQLGIAHIPQGRGTFVDFTVEENLALGAYTLSDKRAIRSALDYWYGVFPWLAARRNQPAGSLSGGEQQMLALGRALMVAPKILLVDEPSVGLAPLLVSRTIDVIKELKEQHQLTVLMAEQNFTQAIRIADRGYVIVHGKIAVEGRSAAELNDNELIRKFYLGL
jgi:branched-chain amino acid transport system ATP-binding protein